ncbi:MAG: acetoacetate--CoA ligase [Caulobacter sp.]|nr:acetoacetate--CoA ligase [Caulobacter sp.]
MIGASVAAHGSDSRFRTVEELIVAAPQRGKTLETQQSIDTAGVDQPIHVPPKDLAERSQMADFRRRMESLSGQAFADHADFHRFSVENAAFFWSNLLDWLELPQSGSPVPALEGETCETARHFPDLRLNYAECLLQGADGDLALLGLSEGVMAQRLSRAELRNRVERLAAGLQSLGLRPGDPVAAVLRNDVEAVIAVLAVAACGGVVATAAPDMGADLLAARLSPFAPKFLLTALAPRPRDSGLPLSKRATALAAGLPSLRVVLVLDGHERLTDDVFPPGLEVHRTGALPTSSGGFRYEHFPFNHPLFVLFSSGTTGPAKGFVHGAGGTLLEHLKEHRLHCDLGPGDRLCFQTSPAWMMWHWQLSALGAGAAILVHDGAVSGPETLWGIAAEHGVTVLGTSPPYLQLCQSLDYRPPAGQDLSSLRAVLSTGSILHPDQARWVCQAIKPLPVQSISGGSDIIGCFVLGHPGLPTFAGEAQCLSLGLDVGISEGELTCSNPFPSRPLHLLADPDGQKFHQAYFSGPDGAWRHGDRIEITPRGGVILKGRMDGVLNIRGIRIGPAEVYRILREIPELGQCLVVEQSASPARDARMVLLATLKPGVVMGQDLKQVIRRTLSEKASAAHVPEIILAVDDLPMTHSGKLSEAAARDVVNGAAIANLRALKNPDSLKSIARAMADMASPPAGGPDALESWLAGLWSELLQTEDPGPDDNFFDLGGHSLMAARILAEIRQRTGRALPMATLLHAPTLRSLTAAMQSKDWQAGSRLTSLVEDGEGAPFFLVHSMTGNVLQLHSLVKALGKGRPVIGIQARGLDLDETPLDRVEAMADDYLQAICARQPRGPYSLGGFSFGGLVAFEMARRLRARGEQVALLVLLDTQPDKAFLPLAERTRLLGIRLAHHAGRLVRMGLAGQLTYLRDRMLALAGRRPPPPAPAYSMPPHIQAIRDGILAATAFYRPGAYDGPILFIRAAVPAPVSFDPVTLWRTVTEGRVETITAPGDHDSMIEPPHVEVLAALLRERLGSLGQPGPGPR